METHTISRLTSLYNAFKLTKTNSLGEVREINKGHEIGPCMAQVEYEVVSRKVAEHFHLGVSPLGGRGFHKRGETYTLTKSD